MTLFADTVDGVLQLIPTLPLIGDVAQWAREQAPTSNPTIDGYVTPQAYRHHRPVRLEIAAEEVGRVSGKRQYPMKYVWIIMARAYLREPRCVPDFAESEHDDEACECAPLAEKRLA
jgi:hypothetical protein